MIARVSLYNRLAIIGLPLLSFLTCCATLWPSVGGGNLPEIAEAAFAFGKLRFLIVGAIGLIIGLLDWRLRGRTRWLFFFAAFGTFFAIFVGWTLAQSIIYF
jgi:hypothetical protein